ncbi:MAG TPA: Xaa-Pro aminopeptidase, partial [Sphingobium sp.]|uniref:aminopeptidase P family protein n=1 Tax=Sphingobium sp. TaxID=1912891 RepID=UPI002ED1F5E6
GGLFAADRKDFPMFDSSVYLERRRALAAALPGALILIPGNDDVPMDFASNVYPFRQDSSFRYFFGLNRPGLIGLIDVEKDEHWLFGDDPGIDATIWLGEVPPLAAEAEAVGIAHVAPLRVLATRLASASGGGQPLLYPPPYRAETVQTMAAFMGQSPGWVRENSSSSLVDGIVSLREIKSADEIAEMEAALTVTAAMHHAAMAATRPGVVEQAVIGAAEAIALQAGMRFAYQPIFSGRGEVLHNLRYDRVLSAGELVVNDSGALSASGYASDITRTLPVSGRFDPMQRRLYDAVLRAQEEAIAGCRPGTRFLDLHLAAAHVLAEELCDIGLFRGDPADVVASGAYALVLPCGLGHQIGLDVHDMEALGEDRVGYDTETRRSTLFGLRSLRLGKVLKAGMTVTVEPGLYFIPQLIDMWKAEGRHAALIDYDRFDAFRRFGGIRIEDDVLVTPGASRILGPAIARTAEEVEARMATAAIVL